MQYRALTIQEVSELASPIFRQYNISKAAVFGSCARGEMRRGSDIDIVVSFEKLNSGFDFFEIKRLLEARLGRKVDLITEKGLEHSAIKDTVATEAKVVYEKGNSNTPAHA